LELQYHTAVLYTTVLSVVDQLKRTVQLKAAE